jgi:hypothetical protein
MTATSGSAEFGEVYHQTGFHWFAGDKRNGSQNEDRGFKAIPMDLHACVQQKVEIARQISENV